MFFNYPFKILLPGATPAWSSLRILAMDKNLAYTCEKGTVLKYERLIADGRTFRCAGSLENGPLHE